MKRPIKVGLTDHIPDVKTLLLFAWVLVLTSCNAQKNTAVNSYSHKDEKALSRVLVDYHDASAFDRTMVIRDKKALTKFFSSVNRTRKPGLAVPQIDFSKNMLVVHFFGFTERTENLGLSVMEETESTILLEENSDTQINSDATSRMLPFGVFKLPSSLKEIRVKAH
ncbi:hypothetical protein [Euzebyella saccharophila]|uniref:Uncharacterized protein n=2 Tax=Euzebyella saccharophila TaxID=679664 RepID=A0ABV8K139_9FLAO|nr:hypothetical protein [Euzebyella saccharophila]